VSDTGLVRADSIAALQREQKLLDLYLFVLDLCMRDGWGSGGNMPSAYLCRLGSRGEAREGALSSRLLYEAGNMAASVPGV